MAERQLANSRCNQRHFYPRRRAADRSGALQCRRDQSIWHGHVFFRIGAGLEAPAIDRVYTDGDHHCGRFGPHSGCNRQLHPAHHAHLGLGLRHAERQQPRRHRGNAVVRAAQSGTDFYAAADPVERTFAFIVGALSPFITSPPLDQTVTAGASVTLRATAIGTPAPAYQWQKNGVDVAGATFPALTFAAIILADAGRYSVTATNLAGTASAEATLTVRAAPVIDTSPASRTVSAGDSVTFTVAVTAFPLPTYQWRKNTTASPGATRDTFILISALATDAGRFDIVATNALGSATSTTATLSLNTRDFSGAYFGRFTGAAGDFALLVRADRTAVFSDTCQTAKSRSQPSISAST